MVGEGAIFAKRARLPGHGDSLGWVDRNSYFDFPGRPITYKQSRQHAMLRSGYGSSTKATGPGATAGTSTNFTGFPGGFNGSTQHSARTRLALKTKAKSLARIRSAGTLRWLGFDRLQANRSVLPGNHWRSNALDGVASTV